MKLPLIILASLAVGGSTAYFIASQQSARKAGQAAAEARAEMQVQMDQLNEQLKKERKKGPEIREIDRPVEVQVPVATSESPEAVLQRLIALRPGLQSRNETLRKVIHELESLKESGPQSLPAIRSFLARNEDLSYDRQDIESMSTDSEDNDEGPRGRFDRGGMGDFFRGMGRTRGGSQGLPRLDFLAPPSLRLGLIDVLQEIGGDEAEAALAEVLQTTGRGIEIAYVTRALEDMVPGKYLSDAVAAAREILSNPVTVDNPFHLDEDSKRYLYGILNEYGDTTFANTAQSLIVTPDGRIDSYALGYVQEHLGENAMPAIYQAYMNPRMTNQGDRMQLSSMALNYAGQNVHANQIYNEIISDTETPAMARLMAVNSLSGAINPFRGASSDTPTDPAVWQSRMQLLDNSVQYFDDERSLEMIERTRSALQDRIDGKEPEDPRRAFRNRFGMGGRGE